VEEADAEMLAMATRPADPGHQASHREEAEKAEKILSVYEVADHNIGPVKQAEEFALQHLVESFAHCSAAEAEDAANEDWDAWEGVLLEDSAFDDKLRNVIDFVTSRECLLLANPISRQDMRLHEALVQAQKSVTDKNLFALPGSPKAVAGKTLVEAVRKPAQTAIRAKFRQLLRVGGINTMSLLQVIMRERLYMIVHNFYLISIL
jgi:hypothetical protein